MVNLTGQQFIGAERTGSGEATLLSLRAADGQPTGWRFYAASPREADAAASAAQAASADYGQTSPQARAGFLEAIADELDAFGEDFFDVVHQETALPLARLKGERARTSGQMRLFAQVLRRGDAFAPRIDTAQADRTPLPRPDLRQYRVALGPVAVFGASNFPLAFSTAGGDTAAALAAGCPVVFKAHEGHMATAELTAGAIVRAAAGSGMPPGVFNLIFGGHIGARLVQHPAIQAVGFTGSLRGGKALIELAQQRAQPIPVFAEMSAVNPLVILPQALATRGEQIARELVASFTLGCGQFCTKPGLIVVMRGSETPNFVSHLAEAVSQSAPQTMLNPAALEHYRQGVTRRESYPALTPLAQGPSADRQASARLWRADPNAWLAGDALLHEELFGPSALVLEADDERHLKTLLAALQGQLTATLHADEADAPLAQCLMPLLGDRSGRLLFNGYPTGVEVCDAMVHGGPWPATSDVRTTSVGTLAIDRFLRPVCLQNVPAALLPPALQDGNPLNLLRLVNGALTRDPVQP
ncbi:aldehyde dehydrogenase (NADP(+)) [Enterobacteriaceae bacterium BIT-l23]|uniref:aldehyde dehydrogenase (NADP(+)) n=1 Tax=Jejubacter sp. L23 TaxID=3092086 RepID=UPI001584AE4E|nr:aldehyde dehydrogenase (NADP(+)) [Enterobacteriaceae bacterium BIT-l23]